MRNSHRAFRAFSTRQQVCVLTHAESFSFLLFFFFCSKFSSTSRNALSKPQTSEKPPERSCDLFDCTGSHPGLSHLTPFPFPTSPIPKTHTCTALMASAMPPVHHGAFPWGLIRPGPLPCAGRKDMVIDGGGDGFQGQVKEVPPLICFKCRASRKREKNKWQRTSQRSDTLCHHVKWLRSDLLPSKSGALWDAFGCYCMIYNSVY